MSEVLLSRGGRRYVANLSDPLSIAVPLDFDGVQPNHYGAPRATARPLEAGSLVGDVRAGGSVNCEALSLVPHCNGTHTECIGHVTTDRIAVHEVLRGGLHIARLVSVRAEPAAGSHETADPDAARDEPVVTARALEAALNALPGSPEALIIRTLPNDASKLARRYSGAAPAPYLTPEAAQLLVTRDVRHLVVDLPSVDRAIDGGRLVAHRTFWGLAAGARRAHDASRRDATITELAWIAPTVRDGWYMLDLQLPAFMSDAAPSRPILYPVRPHD
ncbi:MAG TPA: cyclase family protein [Steroidobacteraceae bacterium]|nr:cyclase family protein [Steroidobacteraceae bacterium]